MYVEYLAYRELQATNEYLLDEVGSFKTKYFFHNTNSLFKTGKLVFICMPKLPLFSVPCRNWQLETLSVAAIFVFVFFIFYTPPPPTFYHSFLLSLCFCCRPFLGVELWDVDSKGARGDAPQTHHLQEGTQRTRRSCYKVRETKLFLYNCFLKLFSPHKNFLCLFLISFFINFMCA